MTWDSGTWDSGFWDATPVPGYFQPQHKTTTNRMKRQFYFPTRISEQVNWLGNFADKLPGYATPLGLDAPTVTAAVADAVWGKYVLGLWLTDVRSFTPATTDAVDEALSGTGASAIAMPAFTPPTPPAGVTAQPPGLLTRLFALVAKCKLASGYTEAIGTDLGVVGAAETPKDVPKLRVEVSQGLTGQIATLKFFKYTHQGVSIESQRGAGGYEFLAIDTESPYVDDRPLAVAGQPEMRSYRMRFWDKGTPNGPWTDPVTVTLAP